MRISAAELDYYRASLKQIGEQAASYVYDTLEGLGSGIGVTAAREAAIQAITETVGVHGEMAQALAGQLFDEVCTAEGMGVLNFEMFDDIIDFGMLEEKVRYYAKALVESDSGKFLNDCSQLAEFYARRCNWESSVRNCKNNNVRYARVPTGAETCDYCIMLASRGFVYWTQEAAEHGNHMHCDCIVVPGVKDVTTIEGYDPDALYDQWKSSGFMPSGSGGGASRNRFIRNDIKTKYQKFYDSIEGATSLDSVRRAMESANANLNTFTDKQVQSLQWAIDRAKQRLS